MILLLFGEKLTYSILFQVIGRGTYYQKDNQFMINQWMQAWTGRDTPVCDHHTPQFHIQYFMCAIVACHPNFRWWGV